MDGEYFYFLGIIDTLTDFNWAKKSEFLVKRVFQGVDISCHPPNFYQVRFMDFMNQIMEGVFEV